MTRTGRTETVAQVLILLLIAGMAGAASFTHVHDWTMLHWLLVGPIVPENRVKMSPNDTSQPV